MTSTAGKAAQVYFEAICREAPRVLGLMDREPLSPTRGCMDRTYWGWKFTDFPGARFQEGVCVLSFLYTSSAERNPYRGNGHATRQRRGRQAVTRPNRRSRPW